MKKVFAALFILVILILVTGILKDALLTIFVENTVSASTGLSLKIVDLRTALIKGRVDMSGLKLFNPSHFKDRIMLDLGHIYASYDFDALFKRNIHLNELDINLKEFMVIKDRDGKLNLNSLKVVKHNEKPDDKKEAPKRGAFTFEIDSCHLKIGKVVYKDYTHGKKPRVKVYNVNMDERFTDIDDIHNLISVIMIKALSMTNIGLLAGFNLELLQAGIVGESIVKAEKVTGSAYKGVKKLIRLPFEAIENR